MRFHDCAFVNMATSVAAEFDEAAIYYVRFLRY